MAYHIKLTGIGDPERPNQSPHPVYIDPSRVLVITRGVTRVTKQQSMDAHRQAMDALHAEVSGAVAQLNERQPKTVTDTLEDHEKDIKLVMEMRAVAQALSGAANLVGHYARQTECHPDTECTLVQLACGTGLEHGVMLACVYVQEAPDEVARLIDLAFKGP